MRISCPHCPTEYDVPDAAIAGRSRTLRCAQCGHQWRTDAPDVSPPDYEAPPAAAAVIQPEPVQAVPEPPAPEPPAPEPPAPEQAAPEPDVAAWPKSIFSTAPAPMTPMITPQPLLEPVGFDDTLDEDPVRNFGQPLDEAERAAFTSAIAREETHAPAEPEAAPEPEPTYASAELSRLTDFDFRNVQKVSDLSMFKDEDTHGFDALVSAARSRSLETEPEPLPEVPIIQRNRAKLLALLIIVLVIVLTLVEHRLIIQHIPGTAGFFHALGLS